MKEFCVSVVGGLIFLAMVFYACVHSEQLKHECKMTLSQQKYTASEIFVVCEAK